MLTSKVKSEKYKFHSQFGGSYLFNQLCRIFLKNFATKKKKKKVKKEKEEEKKSTG
jgi:hypothetical protein